MPAPATTLDLLLGQWQESPRLRAMAQVWLDMLEEVRGVLRQVEQVRLPDQASGVWLDYIGRRLGLPRPSTTDRATDRRFGFDDAGTAFGVAPFRGDAANDARYPLSDIIYRRMLKARALTLFGDGTLATYRSAVLAMDPGASVRDNRNMTVRVVTSQRWVLELADAAGALPHAMGVSIEYADRGRFGFDDAGVPFDQGPFAPE